MSAPTLSAGVVVVRETADGFRFLLLRAYRNWDFPKGLVEPGEDPFAAAVRETREETGIDDLAFDWGSDYAETAPYGRNKVARYYLARTAAERLRLPVDPKLGRPEHHEYRWVDLNDAFALAPARLHPVIAWAAGKIAKDATLA
ncbi:MAG TPA: bis(5'-nucleosyl)-tetraphosphatase [Gammaproteobacteria bacterium]